jgi:hypothetical protein
MSNNYWDEDEDDFDTEVITGNETGSDLLKKLLKAKRADEKRIKELTEQLDGLSKTQRERTVKEVLEKKGVSPKAARLLLKDIDGEVNEESVNNWLDDNAELFGINVPSEAAPEKGEINRAALRQQDALTQGAVTPDRAEDINNRIDNASDMDELLSVLRSN